MAFIKLEKEETKEYKIKPFSKPEDLLPILDELKSKGLPTGIYELETFEGFDKLLVRFDPAETTEEAIISWLEGQGIQLQK